MLRDMNEDMVALCAWLCMCGGCYICNKLFAPVPVNEFRHGLSTRNIGVQDGSENTPAECEGMGDFVWIPEGECIEFQMYY